MTNSAKDVLISAFVILVSVGILVGTFVGFWV